MQITINVIEPHSHYNYNYRSGLSNGSINCFIVCCLSTSIKPKNASSVINQMGIKTNEQNFNILHNKHNFYMRYISTTSNTTKTLISKHSVITMTTILISTIMHKKIILALAGAAFVVSVVVQHAERKTLIIIIMVIIMVTITNALKTVCGRQRARATRTPIARALQRNDNAKTMASDYNINNYKSVKFILNCDYISYCCICMWYNDNIDNNDDNFVNNSNNRYLRIGRTATTASHAPQTRNSQSNK